MNIASLKRVVRTSRAGARLLDKWLTTSHTAHARIQMAHDVDFYLTPADAVIAVGRLGLARLPASARNKVVRRE